MKPFHVCHLTDLRGWRDPFPARTTPNSLADRHISDPANLHKFYFLEGHGFNLRIELDKDEAIVIEFQ